MRIGIFDLSSFFWTLAGARSKDEGAAGLSLQVLRYMRERSEKAELGVVVLASDGPPELPSRSWRLRVDPDYKGHRAPKDEAQREELVALVGALESAGFPVVAAMEQNEPAPAMPEWGSPVWFEADDVAYSVAKKVSSSSTATLKFEAHVFSNDWDLAQVLALPGHEEVTVDGSAPLIRFFTTRGEERTSIEVQKEFGCTPAKLAELKALAGDPSDGYKPFPGESPGKPGIGEKGAADILKAFGSAHAAMAAALSDLDSAFTAKGLPKRIPALLRKGGEAALERGLKLATLRGDVPVPDDFEVGDWEEAEAVLLARKVEQSPPIEAVIEAEEREAQEARPEGMRSTVSEDVLPPYSKLVEKTAEKIVAGLEVVGDAARAASGSVEELGQIVDRWVDEDEALPPAEKLSMEREAEAVDRALRPRDRRVLLTESEFLALAPLPALFAAGAIEMPSIPGLEDLIEAIREGELRRIESAWLYAGSLTQQAEFALVGLAAICARISGRGGDPDPSVAEFEERLKWIPRIVSLADYGKPLVRAT